MADLPKFTVRVYGLFVNDQNQVLVVDEFQLGKPMTKFPGGGLEFGEGTIECLKREAMEEMNQPIEVLSHFYTTDFFQPAFFYEHVQLISIYYLARLLPPLKFKASSRAFDFSEMKNGNMSFRWLNLGDVEPETFTFPVDKKVAMMLKQATNA
ncbi:MAG: NUDIX domain-containing protein [Bacteroidota bacterium]